MSSVQSAAHVGVEPCPSIADELLESYVRWREASEDVRTADEHWRTCERRRRRAAFECYRAALDWEDYAARIYSHWTERLLSPWGNSA